MSPKDVANAVTLVASSPFDRQRYGSMIDHLYLAWLRLLHCRSMDSIVIEDLDAPPGGILGIGVSVFITNEFLRLCKTAPLFWIGPELVRRTMRGDSVILAPKALLAANSGDGVNVFTWAGHSRDIPETEIPQFSRKITGAFFQQHVGFQIREIISQPPAILTLQITLNSGCYLWDVDIQKYVRWEGQDLAPLFEQPFLCGVTRKLALENAANWSWMSPLFVWSPPQIGFAPSEQRLLVCALNGFTDDELSDELAVSSSSVKKTWHSIYERVAKRLPDLLPHDWPMEVDRKERGKERGKEKKQRLLNYVREHREELRPFARRPPSKIHVKDARED
jgi:hypothetical protein